MYQPTLKSSISPWKSVLFCLLALAYTHSCKNTLSPGCKTLNESLMFFTCTMDCSNSTYLQLLDMNISQVLLQPVEGLAQLGDLQGQRTQTWLRDV